MGLRGVAYYDNWMTQYQRSEGDSKTDWLIMCGTNGAARQLVDGNEVANERATRGNGGKGLGVNYAPRYGQWSNERSHWAVAELLVWDSVLSYEEMMQVTRYLKYNVLGYVAPPPAPPPPPEAPPLSIPEGVPKDGLVAWFASKRASADWKSQVGDLTADVKEGKPSVKAEAGHGAAGEVMALYGDTSDKIDLGKILPSTYTICSLTRYATTDRRYMGRILIGGGKSTNWLHGHWATRRGVSHYDGWMTNIDSKGIVDDWLIMCGTNGASRQFVDGDDVATGRSSTQGDLSVGINYAPPGGCCGNEVSNWAVAEILTWSRVLSEDEMRSVTSYLRYDVLGFKRPGPLPSGIPHHNLAVWFPSKTADKDAWLSAVPGGRMLVGSTVGGDVNVRTDEPGQDGAVGAVRCLYGDHNAQFTFGDNVVPTTFTMCSLTRYTTTDGRYQKRILIGGPGNFLHGHWMGRRGVAYYDAWMTPYGRSVGGSVTDWLVMCGTNGAARQLVDGENVAEKSVIRGGGSGGGDKGLGVNYAPRGGQYSNERSRWAVAELLVWKRVLSIMEMREVTKYLQHHVLAAKPPPPPPPAHKFSIVDADHSGGVNRMELVALIEKAAGLNNAHAIVSDDLWNKLDKNDDGKLDAAEFAAVSQRMSAHTLFIEPVLVYPPQKQTAKAFTTIRNVPKVEHGADQQVTTRHQIIEKACENFVLLRQGTLAIPGNSRGWNEWYDELNDEDIDPLSGVKECSALDENETAARVLGDAADAYVLPMLVTAPGSNIFFIDPAAMIANTEDSTEDGEDEDLFARFEREGLTLELKPAETNNGNDVALAVV